MFLLLVASASARPWDLADGLHWRREAMENDFDLRLLLPWRFESSLAPPGISGSDFVAREIPAVTLAEPDDSLDRALLSIGAEILAGSFPERPWTRQTLKAPQP